MAPHIALGMGMLSTDNTKPYTDNSGCVLVVLLALLLCLTPGTCCGTMYSVERGTPAPELVTAYPSFLNIYLPVTVSTSDKLDGHDHWCK